VHTWILSGGFLDGLPGFHYSVMISIYEMWIELKMKELERSGAGAEAGQALSEQIAAEIRASERQAKAWAGGASQVKPLAHPLRRLFVAYVLRGGFLKGSSGWKAARLAAAREYITFLILREHSPARPALATTAP